MSRHLRILISLIAIALSSLLPAQEAVKEPVRPGTILLSAFQTVSEAEKLEEKESYKEAWNKYQQALRYYQSLSAAHPAWKPHIVQGRIEKTSQAIERVQPMAQKEFMAEQAKLQHLVAGSGTPAEIPSPAALTANPVNKADLQQLTKLNNKINQQQRQLESLKNKHTAEKLKYSERINALQKELRKSQQGLGQESTQTRMLNGQIARLQQELRQSKQLSQNDQQKYLNAIEELQRTRTALATAPLRADVEKLQLAKDRQEKELKFVIGKYSSTKKALEIKTLENQKLAQEAELTKAMLAKRSKDLEAAKTNTASVVANMRKEINTLKSKLAEAETIIASQKTEIADLVNRLADSETLTTELRQDLADMTAERDQLSEMLKLSDAERGKQLMKENLRLGRELSDAKRNLEILNRDKNSALDQVTKAETDLAIAKHQLLLKRQENTAFRKRISNLESSLNETRELLATKSSTPQLDDASREEAEILKKTVTRLIAQSSRRRQAERLLWQEYQRTAPRNQEFEEKYLEMAGEDIQLTKREQEMLLQHQSEDTFFSPTGRASKQAQAIAQAKADEKIDTYHAIARRLVEKKNLNFAKDIYDDAYDSIPDYSFLINRGVIRMRLGEVEDAEAIFELGVSQRPRNPYTHFMLGLSRFYQENSDLAAKSIDKAIDLKPDYKEAFLYRGIIEGNQGRHNKALDLFESAVELDPEYAAAHYNIAQTYNFLGDSKKAKEAYNNALRAGLAPDLDFEKIIGIRS
ncbi:tetratricopeptide repeat protein [Rubritalea tangerina]|uniref:Tetratricopeptide repeat protein n=1 Tax=Rubritalea tangerina TaxID=430798 RepID=A0ABW4ZCY3_9BACT